MPVKLTAVVYQVSPYTYSRITADFDSEDRGKFLRSLRQQGYGSRFACLDDEAFVFLVCILFFHGDPATDDLMFRRRRPSVYMRKALKAKLVDGWTFLSQIIRKARWKALLK